MVKPIVRRASAVKPVVKPVSKQTKVSVKPKAEVTLEAKIEQPVSSTAYPEGFRNYLRSEISTIEKKYDVVGSANVSTSRFSTGLLCYDLILGGGIANGMATVIGKEASGKTTLMLNTLGHSLHYDLIIRNFNDAENALDVDYASALFGRKAETLFIEEKIRYTDTNCIEDFFRASAAILRRLPNKRWSEKAEAFVLEWPVKDFSQKEIGDWGFKIDKSVSSESYYRALTNNADPQGLVGLDSLASLMTARFQDEAKEDNNTMAENARAFSKEMPKLIGLLKSKCVAFLAVNQIREKPGVVYGNPTYEPGGNAIQFYTSARTTVKSVRPPYNPKEEVSVEDSGEGTGQDSYAYKHLKIAKNKFGRAYLDTYARVWISDRNGAARGYCPVFDLYHYLNSTNRIASVKGPDFKPNYLTTAPLVSKKGAKPAAFTGTWTEFKAWVLKGEGKKVREYLFESEIKQKETLQELQGCLLAPKPKKKKIEKSND